MPVAVFFWQSAIREWAGRSRCHGGSRRLLLGEPVMVMSTIRSSKVWSFVIVVYIYSPVNENFCTPIVGQVFWNASLVNAGPSSEMSVVWCLLVWRLAQWSRISKFTCKVFTTASFPICLKHKQQLQSESYRKHKTETAPLSNSSLKLWDHILVSNQSTKGIQQFECGWVG